MLSKKAIAERVDELIEIDAMIAELEAKRNVIKDGLTGEMDRRGVEELAVGNHILRWTAYVQNRFDSSGFQKAHPEEYASWQKQVSGHRFSVS